MLEISYRVHVALLLFLQNKLVSFSYSDLQKEIHYHFAMMQMMIPFQHFCHYLKEKIACNVILPPKSLEFRMFLSTCIFLQHQ